MILLIYYSNKAVYLRIQRALQNSIYMYKHMHAHKIYIYHIHIYVHIKNDEKLIINIAEWHDLNDTCVRLETTKKRFGKFTKMKFKK